MIVREVGRLHSAYLHENHCAKGNWNVLVHSKAKTHFFLNLTVVISLGEESCLER